MNKRQREKKIKIEMAANWILDSIIRSYAPLYPQEVHHSVFLRKRLELNSQWELNLVNLDKVAKASAKSVRKNLKKFTLRYGPDSLPAAFFVASARKVTKHLTTSDIKRFEEVTQCKA